MTKEEYTKESPLRVVTLCSGYDSQCMALERLKRDFPGFDYDCIAWAEYHLFRKLLIEPECESKQLSLF